MAVLLDELTKIGLSLLLGSLLGLEREYQNKPAGFRTIALICVGATLFTILSYRLGNSVSVDRVAANIITGIGFIGAGVIFKNNNTVYGLTTASTIWLAAGLGMAVGVAFRNGDHQAFFCRLRDHVQRRAVQIHPVHCLETNAAKPQPPARR